MKKLVNAADLAREFSVSRTSIKDAIESGRLSVHKVVKGRQKFDLNVARKEWAITKPIADYQQRIKMKGSVATNAVAEQFAHAKAVDAAMSARLKKLKVDEIEGRLIDKKAVYKQGAELGAILMGALFAFPDRLSPELAAMSDQAEIHKFLMNEIKHLIEQIQEKCGV